MRSRPCIVPVLALLVLLAHGEQKASRVSVTVVDENGVAVAGARVTLQPPSPAQALRCETEISGRCELPYVPASLYQIHVEKEGYYTANSAVEPAAASGIEITLYHLKEIKETVDVHESPPMIEPSQTQSQERLTGIDVINIPYPATHDYRNILNYIPSVVVDPYAQPHVAGSQTYQTIAVLDGLNVSQPSNGQLLLHVSTDAFRSIRVEPSRYSAEFGKGSGGAILLETGIGDDHYRFIATDFIPSWQNKNGWTFDQVNPRLTLSGPVVKGKIWFFDALDGAYQNLIVTELPVDQDEDVVTRLGNLAKIQANLTSRNILTTSFNINESHDQHAGLSPQNPQASTPAVNQPAYQFGAKDQHYFAGGSLLEAAFGFNRYDVTEISRGLEPYFISPETAGGNFYLSAHTRADRWQVASNLFLRPRAWHGRHNFKVGMDLDRLRYDANYVRAPISYLREGQTLPITGDCITVTEPPLNQASPCSRYSVFPGAPALTEHNSELSGYAQDEWLLTERIFLEAGLRYDWDQIVRAPLFSPRLAATWVPDSSGNTKLSIGFGVFYDATAIFLVARPRAGTRIDQFFDQNGLPIGGPVLSSFTADLHSLQEPRVFNESLALEHKLPANIYLKVEYIRKRGVHGFAYDLTNLTGLNGQFALSNTRQDHYDGFQIGARHAFRNGHMIAASYVRSHARSNQVLDFNIDNPQFSPQQPGPYSWDTPNRFLSYGLLPLVKGFDLAYSTEVRTGFPFNVVNDQQQVVEAPGSRRFPTWFTLNTHIEKRFHALGYYWAIRGGFNNVTGRKNWIDVNNDINSPDFLTYSVYNGRAFTGRIRFLGRK
jgi:Carboxypeptidase regulatory-like domain